MIILPHWPDLPWEEIEEVDRGYEGGPCQLWTRPYAGRSITTHRTVKRFFHVAVGERDLGNNEVWSHLCEVYGEVNLCVDPSHVEVTTKSANTKRHHDLAREAGVDRISPEGRANIRAAHVGLTWGDESREKMARTRHERRSGWGEKNGSAKLTAEKVIEIRSRYAAGTSQAALAREYGMHPASINSIVLRRTWTHI